MKISSINYLPSIVYVFFSYSLSIKKNCIYKLKVDAKLKKKVSMRNNYYSMFFF